MLARVSAAAAFFLPLLAQMPHGRAVPSDCLGTQAFCTRPDQCCPGTSCTGLQDGEGHSLCLPGDPQFAISFNLGTLYHQTDAAVPPSAAVVFLHGYSMDMKIMRDYFFALVDEVKSRTGFRNGDHIQFVFPDAPAFASDSIANVLNVPQPVRGWWDHVKGSAVETMFGVPFIPDHEHVAAGSVYVQSIIAGLVKGGIPAGRIMVAGYSQGSTIALHSALTYSDKLAGVVCLAPIFGVPARPVLFKDVPVFLGTGSSDRLVAPYIAQVTARALNPATPGTSPYSVSLPAWSDLGMTNVTFNKYPLSAPEGDSKVQTVEARLHPFIVQSHHTLGADQVFDAWNFIVTNLPASSGPADASCAEACTSDA